MKHAGRLAATMIAIATLGHSALARQTSPEQRPENERVIIDLTLPPSEPERDPIAERECAEEVDAARIAGEIVVCRSLEKATDGAWDQEAWERDYAERTQGPVAPDVDGSGVQLPTEGSVFTVTVTAKVGDPPPPAVIIDIEALPEAPPGSDADRIRRGVPPF